MRADRLVATLLLLQARGRVTAAEVATELEVSERTARRDLEALGAAGIPVFSQQGRNGGWELIGRGRTDLSGLNAAEARALFLVAGPNAATPEVKAALRKLVRALPESMREEAEAATTAIHVDPSGWGGNVTSRTPPQLDAVQHAVLNSREIVLGYVGRTQEPTTRTVHPLGLTSKGVNWYLIANTEAGQRTFRVDRVTSVEETGRRAAKPKGFDLAATWQLIADDIEERRTPVRARAAVDPSMLRALRMLVGNRVLVGARRRDGRLDVELRGHSARSLAGEVAGLGDALEVFEPAEVRDALVAIGRELVARYATRPRPRTTERTATR